MFLTWSQRMTQFEMYFFFSSEDNVKKVLTVFVYTMKVNGVQNYFVWTKTVETLFYLSINDYRMLIFG